MEEKEVNVLTADAAIVDSSDEALRNLTLAVGLLGAVVKDMLIAYGEINDELEEAFGLIEQSRQSALMYLERMGIWKPNSSQEN